MIRNRNKVFLTLIFSSAALLVVACGGSSTSSGPQPSVSPSAQPSTSTEPGQSPSADGAANSNATTNAETSGRSTTESGKPANPEVAVPKLKISPEGAFSAAAVTVTIETDQSSAPIYYTLDGTPATSKNGKLYQGPFKLEASGQLNVASSLPEGAVGKASESFTIGELFVAANASGDGRWTSPTGSLKAGIQKAKALGIKTIKVLAGSISETVSIESDLTIVGGFKSPLSNERGTTIVTAVSQANDASSQSNPDAAIRVSGKATVALDRIEVRGSDASFGAALAVVGGATVTVKRSKLVGGSGSYSYGIRVLGSSKAVVQDSELDGGNGGSSFGASADNSRLDLIRSLAGGGTGSAVSYAVSMTSSQGTIASSVLDGKAANSSYGVALYSSQGVTLVGSTVLGGKGNAAYAIFIAESEPEIVNCLIGASGKSKSYGLYENYGKSTPKRFDYNALFDSVSGLYFDNDLKSSLIAVNETGAFVHKNGKTLSNQKGNVVSQPNLGAAPAYVTLASSPPEIVQGATVVEGEAATDRKGRPRGAKWAIGAYKPE